MFPIPTQGLMGAMSGSDITAGAALALEFLNTTALDSRVTFSRGTNATLTDSNGRVAWAPHNLLTNSESFEASAWTRIATCTVSANTTTAPDATTTADTINFPAVGDGIYQSTGLTSIGVTYTASVWLWATTPGTVTVKSPGAGAGTIIASVTTTPTRFSITYTATVANEGIYILRDTAGQMTSLFAWGAQLNVANAPVNLLTWSEQFDNAAWTKFGLNSFGSGSVANTTATTDPLGGNTSDFIQETNTLNSHGVSQAYTYSATAAHTLTCYVKAAGRTFVELSLDSADANAYAAFNLTTGQAVLVGTGAVASAVFSGNGWWRCTVTYTVTAGAKTIRLRIGNGVDYFYTGNGADGIFIWGAQLNTGSLALPYVATTSSIYLPPAYNSTTPKNLLGFTQEPENAAWTKSNSYVQQNLLTWSQDFDNAAWTKAAQISVDANVAVDPTGTTTADKVRANAPLLSTSAIYTTLTTAAVSYTYSIYAKADGANFVYLFWDNGATEHGRYFDLVNGTAGNTVGAAVTASSITAVGSGWYRCSITFTGIAATTYPAFLPSTTNATGRASQAGTTPNGILTWGAQLVQGSTAGDYTQTTSAAAPTRYLNWDGTLTGRKLVENTATAAHSVSQNITAITGTPYVIYCYAKAAERQYLNLSEAGTSGWRASFDLLNGTVAGSGGTPSATIVSVGGGWYRCSILVTAAAAFFQVAAAVSNTATPAVGGPSYTGDGTSGIYVSDFQLSNSASVDPYVYNPQAAAASAAYYGPRFDYNPTGTPVLGSEILVNGDFSSGITNWANFQSTIVPSAGGVLLTQTAAAGAGQMYYTGSTAAMVGNTVVASLRFSNKTTAQPCRLIIYNVTAGFTEVARATSTASSGVLTCSGVCPAGATFQVTADISGSAIGESVLIDDVSVKPVTGYTATANGLLIEEQRTNLLTYSEQFDNAAWTKPAATISANATVAPDANTTADTLIENTANSTHFIYQTIARTAGVATYTYSVFLKSTGASRYVRIMISDATTANYSAAFVDPVSGTIVGSVVNVGFTAGSITVTPAGNGWYRGVITATTDAVSTGITGQLYLATTASVTSYTGDGTSGLFIWGAQLELGSFATSYIPTVASQVTRNADSASMLGDNFYTWYNQTAGSWFADWIPASVSGSVVAQISSSTNSNRFQLLNGNTEQVAVTADGVGQGSIDAGTVNALVSNKLSYAYQTNNTAASLNGGASAADTTVTLPAVDRLILGATVLQQSHLNGTIRRIGYYNTRLPDSTLQALTTT